jgi:hypothetical protein
MQHTGRIFFTYHAKEQFANRFPEVNASIYTMIEKSRLATHTEWTDLEIQSIKHTNYFRSPRETVYLVQDKSPIVFVGRKDIAGKIVIITCWAREVAAQPEKSLVVDPTVIPRIIKHLRENPTIALPAKYVDEQLRGCFGLLEYKNFIKEILTTCAQISRDKFIQRWNKTFPNNFIFTPKIDIIKETKPKTKGENPLIYLDFIQDKDFSVAELNRVIGDQSGYHRLKNLIMKCPEDISRTEFIKLWENQKNTVVLTNRLKPVTIGSIQLNEVLQLLEKEGTDMRNRPKLVKVKAWYSGNLVFVYFQPRVTESSNVAPFCGWVKDIANDRLIRGKIYQEESTAKMYFIEN